MSLALIRATLLPPPGPAPDRVLQLLETRSHNVFGLAIALLLVIELHARFFGRDGIADRTSEFAVWLWLRLEQRWVDRRTPRPDVRNLGGRTGYRGTLCDDARRAATERDTATDCSERDAPESTTS
jgi:hypothetical protein